MKCVVIVFFITCVLSAALASSNYNVDKVHSEVLSYVHERMPNSKIMRGNPVHLDCYNGFIELINYLAINAREVSNYCVSDANDQRNQELSSLRIERQKIESEVGKIIKSLADCTEKYGLLYFECLADNAEVNRQLMRTIKNKSSELLSEYSEKSAEIDGSEQICIMSTIDMAKLASDKAFVDLKACINGGPTIQLAVYEV